MFCPKCGAQDSDESLFCAQCGASFTVQSQSVQSVRQEQPVQPVGEVMPVQPSQPASQPFTYGQPSIDSQQTFVQQPQQPQQFGVQPMYAPQTYPQQAKVRTPMSPAKKKTIIIASVCGAVIAAFLIVLFAAIIPNSGFKGKLRHVWQEQGRYSTAIMDLKSKTLTGDGETGKITNWQLQGNHLIITSFYNMQSYTVDYICAMTPDGRTLYLFEADGYTIKADPDIVFTRID